MNTFTKRHLACLALSPIALGLLCASAQAANLTDLHGLDVARVNASYQSATKGMGPAASANARHAEMLGLDTESSLQAWPRCRTRTARCTTATSRPSAACPCGAST